jgi:ankyrin repeat protein
LHKAVKHSDYYSIKFLLEHGMPVNGRNNSNQTPLHIAASQGDVKAVEMLLTYGAHVLAGDIENSSPLHYAARGNHLEVAELLIEAGADVHQVNKYQITALYIAAHFGALDVVDYLIEEGADINEMDQYKAPLMICAAERNTVENVYTVELLHGLGAHLDKADIDGNTALHTTIYHGTLGTLIALVALKANPLLRNNDGLTAADLAERHGYHEVAAGLRVYEARYQTDNGEEA